MHQNRLFRWFLAGVGFLCPCVLTKSVAALLGGAACGEDLDISKLIRKYKNEDTDAVIAVWRAASDLAHPFLSKAFQEMAEQQIRHLYLPQSETWVVEHDGAVVGFIGLLDCLIGGLFVHPDYHGKGLGRALVDKAVALKGPLDVEVFVENKIGRRFYKSYGFIGTKEVTDPHSGFELLQLSYELE
ncbi:GNAT family N-acetyltransferase [Cohaesibacter celericrescens]|uniref:GNAT family N-acetyltransferase n=1 Tax=Cohaesibacter celericrescens TaxID=2067669 RepID=A0A2N5XPR2_9HYPH|nr:GNAT family N-acetyltransferase [Cohaesibacter celericrescens]